MPDNLDNLDNSGSNDSHDGLDGPTVEDYVRATAEAFGLDPDQATDHLKREFQYAQDQMRERLTHQRDLMPRPYIGMTVHYTSFGTPNGEYPSQCRAAVVTEVMGKVPADANVHVSLCVLNPSGQFYDRDLRYSQEHVGGTWHDVDGCPNGK